MSDVVQSLHRQLAELEENLRLIQERKAEYVLETDVPLQLIKSERRLEAQIADLRARVDRLAQRQMGDDDLEVVQVQLALFEAAQQNTTTPRRFQSRIDELRSAIADWDGRVERQRQRIADGLEAQRLQMAEEGARRREQERLRVVGRRPLDVADYFKDRQRELTTVGRLLAEPTTRLVSITGHGGMGKTALACKVLRDLEHHHWPHTDENVPLDGIVYLSTRTAGISLERLFLDCAKLLSGEQETRLSAIWTNPQIGTEDKISHLLQVLQSLPLREGAGDSQPSGRYVILLDNIEDLLDDAGQLTDIDLRLFFEQCLTSAHSAQLLVTSRVALAFRREVMRFDRQVKLLRGLPVTDGVALLRELDPNGDYGLRDAPEEQLVRAVSLVHGVPRALEVLAGILANDPFAKLGEVLETFYEQEDVVHALIEENYKRLDSHARRVIEALAVFRRPVPPLAVDYLLEPFVPGLDVPDIVRRLTRTGIVSVDRTAKTVTLHPIDQDYAYSQLPEEGTNVDAYTRHALEHRAADYYAQLRTPPETWKSIDDLEPQLTEFKHRVRAGDCNDACRVLEPIDFDYLHLWGHYARLVEMRKKLLNHLTDPGLQVANLSSLGRVYHDLAQFERAINHYEEALSIAHEIDDFGQQGVLLGSLGQSYRSLGQIERAIELQEKALTIARQAGDHRNEGTWLSGLGRFYRLLGQVERSVELCEEALSIARQANDHRGEEVRLGELGLAYHMLGQERRAIGLYKKALAIAREIGHRSGEQAHLTYLGLAYYALGQPGQSIKFYREALTIASKTGDRRGESYCLLGLGRALLASGEVPEARECCQASYDLNVPQTSHLAALALGATLLHQHDPAPGEAFANAIKLCRIMLDKTKHVYGPRYALAAALVGQAICDPRWAEGGETTKLLSPALSEYQRALQICAAQGVIGDALRDLELIRMAGIAELEPVFELLEGAEDHLE